MKTKLNNTSALILMSGLAVMLSITGCQTTHSSVIKSESYSAANNSDKKKNPQDIARIRTTLAGQYIRQNKLDAAKRQLERALAADSRYAPAYDMMGVLFQQEGSQANMIEAEKHFKRSISLDKNFMQARNNYGVYLSQANRHDEAIEQFKMASSALGYEGRISALENLGRTHMKVGAEDLAIKSFLRALDNNPNSLVARIELIDLLIKADRISQARQLFQDLEKALGDRPLSSRLMMQGAKLAVHSEDYSGRQKYIEQLLSAYPLSEEAIQVKKWLRDANASWK